MAESQLRVNGQTRVVDVASAVPLLYASMNDLELQGPRFGRGLAQCGSCSVLLDGIETRACVTPVSSVGEREITTLEGLPEWYASQQNLEETPELHPVQQAMIDEQAVQCGYCATGIQMEEYPFTPERVLAALASA